MKRETGKKNKMWIWITVGLITVLAAAGVLTAMLLNNGQSVEPETAETEPTEASETTMPAGRPELYWNIDRDFYTRESESGLSTRMPGEDGLYHIAFAYDGQRIELSVADKQLVNYIDTMSVVGLVQDDNGLIVDVRAPEDFAKVIATGINVQEVSEGLIVANSSIAMNGMKYKLELTDQTEIYNVSGEAETVGESMDPASLLPLDSISVYGTAKGEITHIYFTKRSPASPVYWRAEQMWNSTAKKTSRIPDENGVYSIDFFTDGSIVTLKCKDVEIVNIIDKKSAHSCHFGFVLDAEGYIVETMDSGIGIRGAVAVNQAEVTETDGTYLSCIQQIVGDKGYSYTGNMTQDCRIYDVSTVAKRDGMAGQQVDSLKLGDRICVWTDLQNNAVLIYISNRLVDSPAYYNITRKYDSTRKETTREPVNGYYSFEMVEAGKEGKVILKTADKELASYIDSISNRTLALRREGNIILNAYDSKALFGWSVDSGYIPQIQGAIITFCGFKTPDKLVNYLMTPDYKAYDVTGKDVPYGTQTTVREGDVAYIVRNTSNNGVVLWIYRRMVGGNTVYYNLDYQYNSTTKQTNRKPDEEGWYVFTMAHQGKQVQIKTKDLALATQIDKSPDGGLVVSLNVKDGVAYEIYDTQAAYGQNLYAGYRVSAIHADGTYTVISASGKKYTLKMADDCVIYNVSNVYDSFRGERIYSLQIGDMVASLADYRSDVKLIFVRKRTVAYMYANAQRLYEVYDKVTLREPDGEGWYWFDLAVNGEVKKFKTKDKEIASQIDSYTTPFGLRVKDDEILNVNGPAWVKGVYKAGDTEWDVTAVSGSRVTIKYNKPGSTNTGSSKTISVGSGVKVYDISPTAESFGTAVKLQAGDRIRTYVDRDGNCVYVYVVAHMSREQGNVAYCAHCQQEVFWHPWTGGDWSAYDAHYYMAGDLDLTKQTNVGSTSKDYEIVLDLNGKQLTVNHARAFLIYRGDMLTILDSVGGGSVAATGMVGGTGGVMLMSGEATLNIYGGTFSFIESNIKINKGAVLNMTGSTLNMYGGTFQNGLVNKPGEYALGGNIYMKNATFNMYDGVIEGGRVMRQEDAEPSVGGQGGNIYACGSTVINFMGGEIRNGYSNQHGGNVFLYDATFNMTAGKITGGEAKNYGGNIYNQFGGIVNISGGIVEGGKVGSGGTVLYGSHDTGIVNLSDCTLNGDVTINKAASVAVGGNVKIGELYLPATVKLDAAGLTGEASIAINASGVFTQELDKPEDYLKYFTAFSISRHIAVSENALAVLDGGDINVLNSIHKKAEQMTADGVFASGGTVTAVCPICGTEEQWFDLAQKTDDTKITEKGHYYLSADVELAKHYSVNADICLHLNGHNIKSAARALYVEDKFTLNIMGQGTVTGASNKHATRGWWGVLDVVGSANIYGGTFTCTNEGSVISGRSTSASSVINMYEGAAAIRTDGLGIGIRLYDETDLNMFGGIVSGAANNLLQQTGYFNGKYSVVTIYGGTIEKGTAAEGGNIHASGGTNTLNICGGTIADGNVYIAADLGTLSISGSPVITGLDLTSGKQMTLGTLEETASILVRADGVIAGGLEAAQSYLTYIKPFNENDEIVAEGDKLVAYGDKSGGKNKLHIAAEQMTADGVFASGGTVTAVCPVCGTEEQWFDLAQKTDATKITEKGHYYLSADVELAKHYSVNADICLHLNGHNIKSAARALYVEDKFTLNIMGQGTVTGASNKHATRGWWGVLDVVGSANIYGGTFTCTNEGSVISGRSTSASSVINMYEGAAAIRTDGLGIGIRLYDETDLNMFGGIVSGAANNLLQQTGYFNGKYSVVTIYGGTIEKGTAAEGGNIHASGATNTLNILGGTITEGDVYVAADLGAFTVSGAPAISNLNLTSGKKMTLHSLYSADITVNAPNGAFTEAGEKLADYVEFFKLPVAGKVIKEENGVLVIADAEETDPEEEA